MKYLMLLTLFPFNVVEPATPEMTNPTETVTQVVQDNRTIYRHHKGPEAKANSNTRFQPTPEVTIAQGKLTGLVSADGTFYEYLGIPYATTNSSTRFQAPLPPPSWTGVYKAHEDIYICAQKSSMGVTGFEDCLRMNIFVPVSVKGPLPVMVNIHGGAFIVGSGGKALFGPEFLVKQNVILVSFNYRLGPLGFLCLGTKEVPGNAGMKDQLAALRWIKKNIAAFGGDPDNITIFGESAGGASTSLHLVSETTEGLFKRAIIQSGSAISHWGINREPFKSAVEFANDFGYNTSDPKELYEIFSKMPLEILLQKTSDHSNLSSWNTLIFLPCIEKSIDGIEPFLTDLPYNIIDRNPRNIPIIFGSTSREGLFFITYENETTVTNLNTISLTTSDLEFKSKEENENESERVRKFYFKNDFVTLKNIKNISDIFGHFIMEMPVILEAETYLEKSRSDIFMYYFNYSGGRNLLKSYLGYDDEPGACHGDELLYLFTRMIWPYKIKEKDQNMIEFMTKMWSNFAKYGDPTPKHDTDLPLKWTPSIEGDLRFLYIDDPLKMGPIPNPEAYKMWRDIYAKYRRREL